MFDVFVQLEGLSLETERKLPKLYRVYEQIGVAVVTKKQ